MINSARADTEGELINVCLDNKHCKKTACQEEPKMKCPRCGHEMVMDSHRRMDMLMCYDCGYIEGRQMEENQPQPHETNFERLHSLNFNETVAFISAGLSIDEQELVHWLESSFELPTE